MGDPGPIRALARAVAASADVRHNLAMARTFGYHCPRALASG
jgi:hypothetical protein